MLVVQSWSGFVPKLVLEFTINNNNNNNVLVCLHKVM